MTRTAQNSRVSWGLRAAGALAVLLFILASSAALLAQKKVTPAQPIDLNAATVQQLQQVPGVGPATAKAIVQVREKSGRYQRVEDLLAIHGISQGRFEKMKPYLYVNPPGAK
jgi:competence ComEA-like helix-hairpin-helix protein